MSVLRKFMITVLIVGAATAAPSAALASPTQHAAARSGTVTAPAKVHKVPCRSWTFNVYYGIRGETCYAGAGALRPDIKNVYKITTGANTGFLAVHAGLGRGLAHFRPRQTFIYPRGLHVELLTLYIA
jgi:hypothetical protein